MANPQSVHVCRSSIKNIQCCIERPCEFCAINTNIFVKGVWTMQCRFCNYKNIATETFPDRYPIRWCSSCKNTVYDYLFRCGINSTRAIPHKENGYIMQRANGSFDTCVRIFHSISASLYKDMHMVGALQIYSAGRICLIRIDPYDGNYRFGGHVSIEDFCKWNNLDYQETCTKMQNYFHVVGSRTKAALREPIKLIKPSDNEEKPDLLYHAPESTEYISHNNNEIIHEPIEDQSNDKPIIEKQISLPFLDIDFSNLCDLK
jgi:hypothetical protein